MTHIGCTSELTYTPAWWVPGAHLQTVWGKFARRMPPDLTRSEFWRTPDDDEIEIRRLDAPHESTSPAPRLLILHGLEGTIESHYLRGMLAVANANGWAADVLFFRGSNGRLNRARRLYHAGETSDLDFVVRRLVDDNPAQPIVAVGFSLGGNVLLKWLGEHGSRVPKELLATAAVSVPYDLERGSRYIEAGVSRLYTRHFLRSLRQKASAKLAQFPDLFDPEALERARSLYEFDDAVTAPLHGFAGAHDYYQRSSSLHYLRDIRCPTLLLSSFDDPFLPPQVLDAVAELARPNPSLCVEFWQNGGHVGFVSGRYPWSSVFYAELRVAEFLRRHLERAGTRRFV